MIATANLGFPRMGADRELKWALEKHWRGDLDAGPALAFTTDVLLPVGAVTAVVGLVLALAITEPAETAPVRAGVGCDAHGCAASVGGTF